MPNNPNPRPERLIDAEELCESLQCCRATLYALVKKGVIPPPIKLGRLSRWPASVPTDVINANRG